MLQPTPSAQEPGAGSSSQPGLMGLVDGDAVEDPACVDEFVAVTQQPPVIQFVVDTSGSMDWVAGTERLPEAGERSKWQITEEALATAIAGMPDAAAVGISYYPNTADGGTDCNRPLAAAPIERLTPEHRALIAEVNAAQTPQGGTPTHAAYEFGIEQLQATALEGAKFVVLITDGIPTFTLECDGNGRDRVDGAPLVAAVGDGLRDRNIRTFVIGSPGSEPARDELSQMAFVGGTGAAGCSDVVPGTCHFDMTGEADFSLALKEALGDIAEATLGCNYAVPAPPRGRGRIDLNDVTVVLESGGSAVGELGRAATPECAEGWQYNEDRTGIVLCRSSCDDLNRRVAEDPQISVRVKFGCSVTPT